MPNKNERLRRVGFLLTGWLCAGVVAFIILPRLGSPNPLATSGQTCPVIYSIGRGEVGADFLHYLTPGLCVVYWGLTLPFFLLVLFFVYFLLKSLLRRLTAGRNGDI